MASIWRDVDIRSAANPGSVAESFLCPEMILGLRALRAGQCKLLGFSGLSKINVVRVLPSEGLSNVSL